MSLPSQWDQKINKKIQVFFKSSVVIAVSLSFKETAVKPFVFLVPLICLFILLRAFNWDSLYSMCVRVCVCVSPADIRDNNGHIMSSLLSTAK